MSEIKINLNKVQMRKQEKENRTKNFDEVDLGYSKEEAIKEASRCLQCKHKPCVAGCPIHVKIPEFIKCIAENDLEGARAKIKETHLFPSICGRVCPQELQCEKNCVLAKKGAPISIGHLERFVGDSELEDLKNIESITQKNGKKIAVVGSGPSGLACAGELIRFGFDVTIFEALHEIGGVLTYGIPQFRLNREIVKKTVKLLQNLGVKIKKNFIIGKSITIDELLNEEGFDAVFICSGAGLPRLLNIKGEHSVGVYTANEYLTRVNLMQAHLEDAKTPIIKGNIVITVGGGNVAMDASRTALRLGAKRSIVVYRRTEAEMPARIEEINHAKEEGVEFNFLLNPTEIFADENGIVKSLQCVKMQLLEPDESGRVNSIPIENSETEIPCDVVIVAIGNRPNPLIQKATPDLEVSSNGTIKADENGRTSKKFVYAGGDVVTGAATVVLAIEAGQKASKSIVEDLK